MNKIELNFLPFAKSDFLFEIFRKKIDGATEEKEGIKNYRLYDNKESKERDNYEVSLLEKNGYNKIETHCKHSISLTKWFLIEQVKSNLENNETKVDFYVFERGKIKELNIIIKKFPEGNQIITLSPYYLSSEKTFGLLIDFRFRMAENQTFNKRVQQLSLSLDKRFRSNKNYYLDKHAFFIEFIKAYYEFFSKISTSTETSFISNKLISLNSFTLEKKQYIFQNNKTSYSQFMGVKNFGPYEKVSEDIYFVFIFENRFTNFANELYLSLIGKSNPGTFSGMEQMFGIVLTKSNVEKIVIDNYSNETLLEVIKRVKVIAKNKRVMAVFIEDYNEETGNSEPYYFMKYHFVQNDIPLQVANYNVLSKSNTLKWSTSNLALQMFSKLGGKPWVVNPSKRDCLILGIGSSHKKNSTTKSIEKYFAYSVCLDSSGLYKKLEVLSDNEEKEEEYLKNLENNLLNLLNSSEFNSYKNCVLHLPFKIKRKEIEALQKVIEQVGNMEFTVVKINTKNKFFGFSNHNTLVPYESSYVALNHNEFLVWFEGLQYGKENVDKRLSNPVHIKFLNMDKETYREDYKPYLQDIINLAGANWRGFNAKSVPISIFYSKLITQYIAEFGNFFSEDNKTISNEKPWFL